MTSKPIEPPVVASVFDGKRWRYYSGHEALKDRPEAILISRQITVPVVLEDILRNT